MHNYETWIDLEVCKSARCTFLPLEGGKYFVLQGGYDYEGSSFLGLFDTKEKALAAIQLEDSHYDHFDIYQTNLE